MRLREFMIGVTALLASACTRLDVEVIDVVRVEGYPEQQFLGEASMAWAEREGEFVRIDFTTRPSLGDIAAKRGMQLSYDFHACDAPDIYTTGGNVFADRSREGVYQAYVPAHFSNLSFWVTGGRSGQVGRGWPAELRNERLCIRVKGGVPYAHVVYSAPEHMPTIGQLFESDLERAGATVRPPVGQ